MQPSDSMVRRQSVRLLVVGGIVLGMLVPLSFVGGLADERQRYFGRVAADIAASWGGSQVVNGPYLLIPETTRHAVHGDDGEVSWRVRRSQRVVLPAEIEMEISVEHQLRRRSIYEVPVYEAMLKFRGMFAPSAQELGQLELAWDQARVIVGIGQTQAISFMSPLTVAGGAGNVPEVFKFASSTGESWLPQGVHASLGALSPGAELPFEFELRLKGTQNLSMALIGAATSVEMAASWPHPSFGGQFLPLAYEVSDTGFTATWRVHELARNLPSHWNARAYEADVQAVLASVSLFEPITMYALVDRGIKYGVLFIGLTFLTFVCFELLTPIRFHYAQYGVIGVGLVMFYLVLLSLSEHIAFGLAYALGTAVLTALNTLYLWWMTRSWRLTALGGVVLVALYVALYVLLRLEDFALLVGTGVLLIGLVAAMYATRGLTQDES